MKKQKIFIRVFILFMMIAAVVDCILYYFGGIKESVYLISGMLGEIAAGVLISILAVVLFQDTRIVIEEVPAKYMIVEYALSVETINDCIVGVLPKWRRFCMGNIMYDQKSKVLVGPKYLVVHYNA